LKEHYAAEITDESKNELVEFIRWYNHFLGHKPLIVGGWAAWAYHKGIGSKDIDVVFPQSRTMHQSLLQFFKSRGYEHRKVDLFDYEFFKTRTTPSGRKVEVLIDAVSADRRVRVTGTALTIPWQLAEKYKRTFSFAENAEAYIIEPELLFAYKIGALIGRSNSLKTATEAERLHYQSKLWKDAQDLLGLFQNAKPRPKVLGQVLQDCGLDDKWLEQAFSIAANNGVFAWLCSKHDKWIAVKSANTLAVDIVMHEKWHEIND